ncbi:hypothetical protein N8I71_16010 [Roseibacterium sp. SDUM158016]|jgi:hypothetical protein|nr:hypothetical protein [Roseibacterium sp. SDUM158016]
MTHLKKAARCDAPDGDPNSNDFGFNDKPACSLEITGVRPS